MIGEHKILLEKPWGKNNSLIFYGERPELYKRIKAFLMYHNSYLDAEHHKIVNRSAFFVQSDHSDFLMLEFWAKGRENFMPVVKLLAREFDFTYEDTLENEHE
jgi:hypothetical protein